MADKIPYEQVIVSMKADIDYVAEEAYRKGADEQYKKDAATIEQLTKDKEKEYQRGQEEERGKIDD